jgi:hypothetical protein
MGAAIDPTRAIGVVALIGRPGDFSSRSVDHHEPIGIHGPDNPLAVGRKKKRIHLEPIKENIVTGARAGWLASRAADDQEQSRRRPTSPRTLWENFWGKLWGHS